MHRAWNLRPAVATTALLFVALVSGTLDWRIEEGDRISAIQAQEQADITVRISGKRLDDGRTELALQIQANGKWHVDRLLPDVRYLPVDARADRWYLSSAIGVPGGRQAAINAKIRADGTVEFALREINDGALGGRQLPERRVMPGVPPINRWLNSSTLIFSADGLMATTTPVPVANANGQSEANAHVRFQAGSSHRGPYALVRNWGSTLVFEVGCSSLNARYAYFSSFNVADLETIEVTLMVDGISSPPETWNIFRFGPDTSTGEGGVYPSDPTGLVNRLRTASSLTLTIHGSGLAASQFDLTGMFDTPVQPNLDLCGSS